MIRKFKLHLIAGIVGIGFSLHIPLGYATDRGPLLPHEKPWDSFEEGLSYLGYPTDNSSLVKLAVSDKELDARAHAITILGLRKVENSRAALQKVYNNKKEEWLLRFVAAQSLGFIDRKEGVKSFRELTSQTNNKDRKFKIAKKLAQLNDASGCQEILDRLKDPNPYRRSKAVYPLGLLVGLVKETSKFPDPLGKLRDLANDPFLEVRKAMFFSILSLPPEKADKKSLITFLKKVEKTHKDKETRKLARLSLLKFILDKNNPKKSKAKNP